MFARVALGLFGVVELLFPRRVVDGTMRLATTTDSDVEFRPWVYRVARLEGLAIALWAFRSVRRSARLRRDRPPATTPSSEPIE